MLSSINFLFLLSLGFVSWTILCYIQQIEQFIDFRGPIKQEPPKDELLMTTPKTKPEHIVQSPSSNHDNYDLYVNFLGIFVCIYALAKVTHIAEMYMAKRIRNKIFIPVIQETESADLDSISDLQEQQENLKSKIKKLEKQNQEINFKLKTVVGNGPATSQTNMEEKIHNFTFTNKHIHLNRQIFVSHGASLNMTFAEKKPEPTDIWDKYMDLKDSLMLKTNAQITASIPVVLSSEELSKIKAVF